MASKSVYCYSTDDYYVAQSAYTFSADGPGMREYNYPIYKCSRMTFPSLEIGDGALNSATLHFRPQYLYQEGISRQVRIAASNEDTAHTTAISSGYTTKTASPYIDEDISVDVTSLLNGIYDYNSMFYLFGLQMSPGYDGSNQNDLQYYGSAHNGTWPYTSYRPYIEIDYVPANTDSQFYLGVGGAAKVTEMYLGVGGVPKKVTDIYIGVGGVPKRVEL